MLVSFKYLPIIITLLHPTASVSEYVKCKMLQKLNIYLDVFKEKRRQILNHGGSPQGFIRKNVVSNQICYHVQRIIKAKNMQPVALWTYRVPQGHRKPPPVSKRHLNMACICILKQRFKSRLCIGIINIQLIDMN
jgi:hypothetical protein